MPFSKILLISAKSEKCILGKKSKGRSHRVQLEGGEKPGELALFFDIDSEELRQSLDLLGDNKKCCDGLIFYTHDKNQQKRVICLVEMKSDDPGEASQQIGKTYEHLKTLLKQDCQNCSTSLKNITWKACIYRHGPTPKDQSIVKSLIADFGFAKGNITLLNPQENDIGPFLRGEIKAGKGTKAQK